MAECLRCDGTGTVPNPYYEKCPTGHDGECDMCDAEQQAYCDHGKLISCTECGGIGTIKGGNDA